jgi:hypothetical protein
MTFSLNGRPWWGAIDEETKELLLEAELLSEKAETWTDKFADYSFVVFPAAKAYEGFLKKTFLDMGFISEEQYYGKRFRVGKALNPNLESQYRNEEGVYDRIVDHCGGKELADKLWDTWRSARNMIFHWFPRESNRITLGEANQRILSVVEAMDALFADCKIKPSK